MADATLTADGRARLLRDGNEIPLLGLGVWQTRPGGETEDAVRWALEAGYRHVDTAKLYGNEQSVGRALAAAGVPRDELFVTTKLLPRARDPRRALEASLRLLDLDRVDLYLIHWPTGLAAEQWTALEDAYDAGLARAIGVSNWSAEALARTVARGRVVPHVNQVQFSPFQYRRALLDECRRLGVVFESYSPLARGRGLRDPTVARVAHEVGRTPAQVMLRWALERDVPVIPKSVRRERIVENAAVFDFALEPEAMAALDALDETGGSAEAR
jgi:diketogulonate reductase-like aldo/keto reductase